MNNKHVDLLSGVTLALDVLVPGSEEFLAWLSAGVQAFGLGGAIWDDWKTSVLKLKAHQDAGTEPSREERDASYARITTAISRAAAVDLGGE